MTNYNRSTKQRTRRRRPKLSEEQRQERNLQALGRARLQESEQNDDAVREACLAAGIPADDIIPRENVLTYNAWQAAGRQVQRGQKAIKCTIFLPIRPKDIDLEAPPPAPGENAERQRFRKATISLFHISQTDEIHATA